MQDYIRFHKESVMVVASNTSDSRYVLRPGSKYLAYRCTRWCGGLGNRLHGIAMAFYVAMLLNRTLLVEEWPSSSPAINHPLTDYVGGNLIRWDAVPTSPLSTLSSLTIIDKKNHPHLLDPCRIDNGPDGYAFQTNVFTSSFSTSECWKNLQRRHGDSDDVFDARKLRRLALQALFKFRDRVVLQAKEILETSDTVSRSAPAAHNGSVRDRNETPFMAIHVRTGKGSSFQDPLRHHSPEEMAQFINCSLSLHESWMQKCNYEAPPKIYVAADQSSIKEEFVKAHPSLMRTAADVEVLHIERSRPNEIHEMVKAYDNVWAELKILADSTCLIASKSTFSDLGEDFHPTQLFPRRCSVQFNDCDSDRIEEALDAVVC